MHIQIDFKEEIKIENFINLVIEQVKAIKLAYRIDNLNSFIISINDDDMMLDYMLDRFDKSCDIFEISKEIFNKLKINAKLIYNNLLEKPKSLFDQAEQLDTEEAYENLKELYCNMNYSEILNQLNDIIEATGLIVSGESNIKDYTEKDIIADKLLELAKIGEVLKNISQIQKLNITNNVINEYKKIK